MHLFCYLLLARGEISAYAIKWKLSDVDNLIRTSDRWKNSHKCHINILKQYHVIDKSGRLPENPVPGVFPVVTMVV